MEDKVSISHGLSLVYIDAEDSEMIARKFKNYGISINTTQPLDRSVLPFMHYL